MFFTGTLQEGISAALQQSKQVVCFVADDGDESQQWETEYFTEDSIHSSLQTQAVTLRLPAGSEGAGYLEALFPVPRKPTVVVIQNGQLKEYIAAGTTKEEFIRRLSLALGGSSSQAPASAPASTSTQPTQPTQPARTAAPAAAVEDALAGDAPSSAPAPAPALSNHSNQEAARLAADKEAREAAGREEARRRVEERSAAGESNEGESTNAGSAENKYASSLRKKKQEEKAERQRILKRIEDDKRARREREAQERQARLLLAATEDEGTASTSAASTLQQRQEDIQLPSRGGGAHCNLQVRLLDGSRIRNRFPSDVKLGTEVRKWIDENRSDGDEPYTFRVVLAPLPNKTIEPSEEADSLLDLGLAPSSTLILVPRVRVASAFQQTGGAIYRVWSGVWALLAMILSFPLTLVGSGRTQGQQQHGEEIPMDYLGGHDSAARGQDVRFRGFQNPDDRRRDQELYNGNSLNFEPRTDNEDQEEN
ncbi:hypothetical protein SUNI508_01021 [Seiridium unicorne]|uniref:UBX domain-containing protein n=1 Tax=Seiridium unicorne TaxID=138068 RepID=A0ABR2V377_9PEZI